MSTVALDAPITVVGYRAPRTRVGIASGSVGNIAPAVRFDSGPLDQLVVRHATERGLKYTELRSAVVDEASWVLQGVGELSFTMSTADPCLIDGFTDDEPVDGVGQLRLLGVEVEWWRDGAIRWKGVPVSAEVDGGTITVQCYDLGWYLTRRFMGAAQRRDLLNLCGQMDVAGLPFWIKVGGPVRNTSVKVRGVGSAQMPAGSYMVTSIDHPTHLNAGSLAVYGTAMVRVQPGTEVGTVLMAMSTLDPNTGEVMLPDPDNNSIVVTEDMVQGGWNRVRCHALLPPGTPPGGGKWRVTMRLSNVGSTGNRYFDDVRMLKNDTTGFPSPGKDLCTHGTAIIDHVNNKKETGIGWRVLEPSGTVEVMGVRHLEHTQILDLLNGYGDRIDGFEWWIDPRDPARPLICFAPRRGVDQDEIVLHDRAVLGGGWEHDESDRATGVVVVGEGGDVDRPEGGFQETSVANYLLLEHYERPANGTPLAALDPMAQQLWAQKSKPQVVFGSLRVPEYLWDEVSPGDVFPVERSSGVLRTEAVVRVQKIAHDFETETLVLT